MTSDLKLTLRAFEKCGHCSDVYFFFLEVISTLLDPGPTYLILPARSRQEGFHLLAYIRVYSKDPMTDVEYGTWASAIANSTLPEHTPAREVLAMQEAAHIYNRRVLGDLTTTSKMLDFISQRNPGTTDS